MALARAALLAAALVVATAAGDDFGGLAEGEGRELVHAVCSACHSLAIVKQQRLSRAVWDEVLTWMVEEQGMPELEPAERATILAYLARAYAPDTPR